MSRADIFGIGRCSLRDKPVLPLLIKGATIIMRAADIETLLRADRVFVGVVLGHPRYSLASHVRADFADWLALLTQVNNTGIVIPAADYAVVQGQVTGVRIGRL
jgi:hypothetical protein